ncbi:MAG: hypothetical protein IJQ76_04230 [Prevotella sp.]|nr:hypothetical protein [Prevotella sp.]
MTCGTKINDERYRSANLAIAASSQQYCWLGAAILLAGGSNSQTACSVPQNANFCTLTHSVLYHKKRYLNCSSGMKKTKKTKTRAALMVYSQKMTTFVRPKKKTILTQQ